MPINKKSVTALLTSAILLVATAMALYVYTSYTARNFNGGRRNHSEVRAALNVAALNLKK